MNTAQKQFSLNCGASKSKSGDYDVGLKPWSTSELTRLIRKVVDG